jgi:hypothetical protein
MSQDNEGLEFKSMFGGNCQPHVHHSILTQAHAVTGTFLSTYLSSHPSDCRVTLLMGGIMKKLHAGQEDLWTQHNLCTVHIKKF